MKKRRRGLLSGYSSFFLFIILFFFFFFFLISGSILVSSGLLPLVGWVLRNPEGLERRGGGLRKTRTVTEYKIENTHHLMAGSDHHHVSRIEANTCRRIGMPLNGRKVLPCGGIPHVNFPVLRTYTKGKKKKEIKK